MHMHTHTEIIQVKTIIRKEEILRWEGVLVMVTLFLIKHHDQKSTPGRKGFIWLVLPGYNLSLREFKAGI